MSDNDSVQRKRLLLLAGLLVLPLVVLSAMGGYLARGEIRNQTMEGLEAFAASQKDSVEQTLDNYTTIHRGIASRTQLRVNLNDYNATGSATEAASMNRILADGRAPFKDITDILLLDARGKPVTGVQAKAIPASLHAELFSSGSKKTTFKTMQSGKNSHVIIHADSVKQNNKVIGVLVMAFSPEALKPITHLAAGLGQTGETVLAYRKGNEAVFLPTRLQSSENTVVVRKGSHSPTASTLFDKQDRTLEKARDYRGAEVAAVTKYIDKADWALVTKKDQSEIFHKLSTFTTIYIFIAIMILTTSLILLLFTL